LVAINQEVYFLNDPNSGK